MALTAMASAPALIILAALAGGGLLTVAPALLAGAATLAAIGFIVSNLARPEAGPALPVSHSIRIFAGDVRALPSSVSMPRAIVGGMLRPGWRPESGGGE